MPQMPTISASSVSLAVIVRQETSVSDIFPLKRHVIAPRGTVGDIHGVGAFFLQDHFQVAARGVGRVVGINTLEFGTVCQGEADPLTLQHPMSATKSIEASDNKEEGERQRC